MSDVGTNYLWGVDCGSAEIKVVVCDASGKVIEMRKARTLFPLLDHVRSALNATLSPFESDGMTIKPDHRIVVTGYGRNHVSFAHDKLTEIKAHFLGVQRLLNLTEPHTIIDIGGQDSKVIAVDASVKNFIINRKCAAGTGAFIEELAHRLQIPIGSLPALAVKYDTFLTLNSYCTVFAGQEVLKILMEGEKVENIIHALYQSVAKRVLEMTAITTDLVVFTGGVMQFHPPLLDIFASRLPGRTLRLAPDAQYCGALGAACFTTLVLEPPGR